MTGFLNNPFLVEIAQLDAIETDKDPDGAGLLTSGFDDDFKETIPYDQPNADGSVVTRTTTRKENTICAPAQISSKTFEALQQLRSGNSPDAAVELTFLTTDLASLDLIDPATGLAKIKVNDRLVAIRDCDGATLIQRIPDPPGLFVTHVRPSGFLGHRNNLFIVTFEDRAQGIVS